eukprot:scaffold4592_cov56-Attheya_sp.AAC.2
MELPGDDTDFISVPLAPLITPTVRMSAESHRVLIYTTCYNIIDGVTLTIRKIEQEILASGGHVFILTTKSGNVSQTNLDGEHPNRQVVFLDTSIPIPFCHVPDNPDASYHLGFSLSSKIKRQIDEFEPSIIHITVPDCTGLYIVQYARQREIPLMGTYHSNIPEYMDHYPHIGWLKYIIGGFSRHQYNFFQALYVPTPYIRKHLCDVYKINRITNLDIWGRGIDLEKFSPKHRCNMFRQKLGIDEDEVVITFVGRLVPEKRPDIFARVIRRLHSRNVPFHALVIGAGTYMEEMKALPNTTCTGWLTGDELPIAYASSDVFLFPSAVETFGNVTLEAAASGLPLIVEGGCSGHLVKDGINGYAIDSDDEESFYQATLSLIVDNERRHAYGQASREFSLTLEKRKVVRQMLQNYSRVTEEFYTQYAGRHKNRDAMYQNRDSFWGGTQPRPLALYFIEVFFIICFKFMWNILLGFTWLQETFLSTPQRVAVEVAGTATKASPPIMTGPAVMKRDTRKLDVLASLGKDSQQEMIDECGLVLEDISEDCLSTIEEGDSLSENGTESTGGMTSSLSGSICCSSGRKSVPIGDGPIAAFLAKAFIKVALAQWRFESNVVNACTNVCSSTSEISFLTKRKRKHSDVKGRARVLSAESDGSDSTSPSVGIREDELEYRAGRRSLPQISL